MKLTSAVKTCEEWLAHCDRLRARTLRIQELAALARLGPISALEAQRELAKIDNHPMVWGGDLQGAVQRLLDEVSHGG